MKKQLVIIGAVALLVSVVLSGCNQVNNSSHSQGTNSLNSEEIKFVGSWVNISTSGFVTAINLFSDSTSVLNTLSGTWGLKDTKLMITFNGAYPASNLTYNYVFSNNNSTLSLTLTEGGVAQIFTKRFNPVKGDKNTFVGSWVNISVKGIETKMNFSSTGYSTINTMPGIWDLKDGKLVIRINAATSWVYNFVFSDNNSTLSLTSTMGGVTQVFTKK
jgi:hypothetical protein